MILRHFEIKDIRALKTYRYPEKTEIEILSMINEWNKAGCSGRFFEMFTIAHGGQAVGELSVYEHNKNSASIGIHIFEPFRHKGFAKFGIKEGLEIIKEKGYKYAVSLIEKNNVLAIKLFESLNFERAGEFVNPKGYTICTLKKTLI